MKPHKLHGTWLITLLLLGILSACQIRPAKETAKDKEEHTNKELRDPLSVADELEESLFKYILEPWYPRIIDSLTGGYHSEFEADWSLGKGSGNRALVQQARHVWATSRVYEAYPEKTEFIRYAEHGFKYLRDAMWDQEYGGFHAYCSKDGQPLEESMDDKRIYGQSFGIYGLSQYYRVSKNTEALELAKKAFLWMEEHAHDKIHGGYFEFLHRDGSPLSPDESPVQTAGLKDFNSSIHLLEAFTELYLVWPDALVRTRLEEMFYLIRDTFVHPEGYLRLYFDPDWTHVREVPGKEKQERFDWVLDHFSYGHDVETAFLLLEAAHVLGLQVDEQTHRIAKRLVDHSLASGWDTEYGGFFDAGIMKDGQIKIVNHHKSWWGLVEGMNALLLMHTLYPEDELDYFSLFLLSWKHIDTYLIDKTHGGWYNASLDTYPESKELQKSHIWKTTYHNARGLLNCIKMLRTPGQDHTKDSQK